MPVLVKYAFQVVIALVFITFICEVLVYYITLLQCSWPDLDDAEVDESIQFNNKKPVHVMILADTHLLGVKYGHWLDKLRREWQMRQSFQVSMLIHNPEVIFFLGDLFDEGLWASKRSFKRYTSTFKRIFNHSIEQESHVVVGNHDIGFHDSIIDEIYDRFEKEFDAPPVKLVTVRGVPFVLINSMAMEDDDCYLCYTAVNELKKISSKLNCSNILKRNCDSKVESYVQPIILQHFPLYRDIEKDCKLPDEKPISLQDMKFRENWECLSKSSTNFLLKSLNPRGVFSGHYHYSCYVEHKNGIPEWTVASFNWRNNRRPSFILGIFAVNRFVTKTCYLPDENTIICMYIFGIISILVWLVMKIKMLNY